ncbi:type II secretion system F family protein [Nocardioides sp.]|uniref:type II secretion system F family protein n=1 Tax=Nocardioides sp. TaxID=35761 RepID=UPI0035659A50
MTAAGWGAVLGAAAGLGIVLVLARVRAIRQPPLAIRVLPYLRDLSPLVDAPNRAPGHSASPLGAATGVFGPVLRSGAEAVERVLGGETSVRRRIERAGLDLTVHEVRVQQVVWGLVGFAVAAAYSLLKALTDPGGVVAAVMLSIVGFAAGVLARDNHLSGQARRRERRIIEEFPALAELLALAVAAGEGPVSALDRVVRRSDGAFSADLARVLADVRLGEPVGVAFDELASRTAVPAVARFAQGIAIAIERGTPLADVLHAQAADVRDASRRDLIESAARREVLMMVPVVFLVLPVTVLFAFWPGVVGLSLTTP